MKIDILISNEIIKHANTLLMQPLPSSIRELWNYFQDLSNCLWKIRDEVNSFIDAFPTNFNLPCNFRYDSRFNDSNVKTIENSIESRMEECSEEADRIVKEKEKIALENINYR